MNHLKTLRVRFALWTAGLLLTALLLFSFFIYIRTAQSLADSVDSALRLAASQVAAEVDVAEGELVPIDTFFSRSHAARHALRGNEENASLLEQGFSFRVSNGAGQTLQTYGPYRALPQPQLDLTAPDQAGIFTTFTDAATQHPVRV